MAESRIFICYRREDSKDIAGRLRDKPPYEGWGSLRGGAWLFPAHPDH